MSTLFFATVALLVTIISATSSELNDDVSNHSPSGPAENELVDIGLGPGVGLETGRVHGTLNLVPYITAHGVPLITDEDGPQTNIIGPGVLGWQELNYLRVKNRISA